VIELRNRALASTGSPASQGGDESALNAGLRALFALAEAYPDLKADTLFLEIQGELVNTEDRLAATRRFYNGNVRELNELLGQFPSNLVGNLARMKRADFFALDDDDERTAPRVEMQERNVESEERR
jgi:LemA protein